MKRIANIGAILVACAFATLSDGATGYIGNAEDLAKGVKLAVRVFDGDTSFERDRDAVRAVEATLSYLHGFVDCALGATYALNHLNVNRLFDVPDRMNVAQLARVVDNYITDHPEQLHEPPGVLCFNALLQAFPVNTDPRIKAIHGKQ